MTHVSYAIHVIYCIDGMGGGDIWYAMKYVEDWSPICDRRWAIGSEPFAYEHNANIWYRPTSDSDIALEGGHMPSEQYIWCLTAPPDSDIASEGDKEAFVQLEHVFWEKGKVNEFGGVSFGILNGLWAIGRGPMAHKGRILCHLRDFTWILHGFWDFHALEGVQRP